MVWDGMSSSGGPPVPRICDGTCALGGATKPFERSSMETSPTGLGVLQPLFAVLVTSESCLLSLTSASGIASLSSPSSSALSVIALLEEPRTNCRPLTRYAVPAITTTKPTTEGYIRDEH